MGKETKKETNRQACIDEIPTVSEITQLEVGKEYLNTMGERVKIVDKSGTYRHPYAGRNQVSKTTLGYAENGQHDKDHWTPYDLMIEVESREKKVEGSGEQGEIGENSAYKMYQNGYSVGAFERKILEAYDIADHFNKQIIRKAFASFFK